MSNHDGADLLKVFLGKTYANIIAHPTNNKADLLNATELHLSGQFVQMHSQKLAEIYLCECKGMQACV